LPEGELTDASEHRFAKGGSRVADRPTIVVAPHPRRMQDIFAPADLARLHDLGEVVWGSDDPLPTATLRPWLPAAEAIVCCDWPYGDLLDEAPRLRAILDVTGSFPRRLNYATCLARGIRVLSAAPSFARQVAEMALGLALAASREIVAGDAAMRAGDERWLQAGNQSTFLLYGKPVGFIGYGNLARALRPLLAPFGCPIAVYDPWLGDGYLRGEGLTPLGLDTLLARSKVIFVLAVPTAENRALLSRSMLEHIQPGTVLVLMSRAHVADFDALTELVLAGRFKLATDVFPVEPLPLNHPIRRAPHTVLSAHRAGSVAEGLWEIGQMVVDDLEMILRGLPPQRLQAAQPELAARYVRVSTRPPDESRPG
jgi:phosphoglycerate dehydrogenase-like enzyme